MATWRFIFVSAARYTSPIPPAPSEPRISYGPRREPGVIVAVSVWRGRVLCYFRAEKTADTANSIVSNADLMLPSDDARRSRLQIRPHFLTRTTKSGDGGAKPAVTAYNALPNSAIVVGTFVAEFDVNGSVMTSTIVPDR